MRQACKKVITQPLIEVMNDDDPGVRRVAVETLGRLDKEVVKPLLYRALDDTDPGVRHRAALALARIDPQPGRTVAILAEILTDQDAPVDGAGRQDVLHEGSTGDDDHRS